MTNDTINYIAFLTNDNTHRSYTICFHGDNAELAREHAQHVARGAHMRMTKVRRMTAQERAWSDARNNAGELVQEHGDTLLYVLCVVYPGCEDGILWYFDSEEERAKAHDIAGGMARWSELRGTILESELPADDFVTEAFELENCLREHEEE